jgi:hypothetical protein
MTTWRGQSDAHARPPISEMAARQIAGSFRLGVHEVFVDAQDARTWAGPADDLLAAFESRHAFQARAAVAYLLSLRSALRSNSTQS